MTIDFLTLIFLLLAGHALADFALQTEWIATNKNRHTRDRFNKNQEQKYQIIWPYLLSAHALIHGLMVYLICNNIYLALAETGIHWIIDFGKNENWYGFHTDQILHILCKFAWAFLYIFVFLKA